MKYSKIDVVKDIVFFLLTTAFSFVYWMVMLLLISFMTSSFIKLTIEWMIILAIVCTIGVDVYYVIAKIKKYKK